MTSIPDDLSLDDAVCCLYVVQIDRGRIKVGLTARPGTRLSEHRRIAEAHGCVPGPEWVSPRGVGTTARENALIEFCDARATARFRAEYFTGVPFLAAVREAVRLCEDKEAAKILRRPRTAQALTALAETRKKSRELVPILAEAAERRAAEARLLNPWLGRSGRCTEAEAAEWLGVSADSVLKLISSGELLHVPATDPRRRLYIRTSDVERVALHGERRKIDREQLGS